MIFFIFFVQCTLVSTKANTYSVYIGQLYESLPLSKLIAEMKIVLKSENVNVVDQVNDIRGTLVYVSSLVSSKPMNRVDYPLLKESENMYDQLVLVYLDGNQYKVGQQCDSLVIDGLKKAEDKGRFQKPVSSILFHYDSTSGKLHLCVPSDHQPSHLSIPNLPYGFWEVVVCTTLPILLCFVHTLYEKMYQLQSLGKKQEEQETNHTKLQEIVSQLQREIQTLNNRNLQLTQQQKKSVGSMEFLQTQLLEIRSDIPKIYSTLEQSINDLHFKIHKQSRN